ncbi:CHAD domain-containing protein [Nocardia camponoti]|uniref:CHAD domain-containing protein n=1 Tax=Nocardia camponoti TaxID=1616106 RepID=A0A917QP70_9NOCA|nr:CHAD domain-containing protein [Nocardia camponoti]GGK61431.1 hypothetical protein GCM10011591_37190 [Nocardia camponoti]
MGRAGIAVAAVVREEITRLLATEPDVRADRADAVHQMRIAARRLRSVVRSYRTIFDENKAAELGDELRWLGRVLGVARDAEVRADRFERLLSGFPDAPAEVRAQLVDGARARYADAHADILAMLRGKRFRDLTRTLETWQTEVPLSRARAWAHTAATFDSAVRHDRRRLRALVLREREVDAGARVELLHDIRKAAKRLRYCCEAAATVSLPIAEDLGARAKRLQTVLGDHRDAVESREAILAFAADADGPPVTVYEQLADTEEAAANLALSRYPAAAAFLTTR